MRFSCLFFDWKVKSIFIIGNLPAVRCFYVSGVALAAIQALYQQNQEKEAKIAELENQVESQRGQLETQQEYLKTLEVRFDASK